MVLDQFRGFLVLLLVAAAIVSALLPLLSDEHGDGFTDALVILAILILNAFLGVAQERKANRALEALKKMSVPRCEVIRETHLAEISSEELVPGDLVVLREGDFIPADMRVVENHSLRIDEASLTGESAPVEKTTEPIAEDLPLADRLNMAYAGTHVTYGRGRGLVVATGLEREIGRIAQMLQKQEDKTTPLQKSLARLGRLLGIFSLIVCGIVFVLGLLHGQKFFSMFMTAVSLAVAAIPEGLPAIVAIVLGLGVYRMSRRNAIIRKLPAVETLGCATYICTDKTGTLTENRMTVREAVTMDQLLSGQMGPSSARESLLEIAVLCNDAHVEGASDAPNRFGDPTELALVDLAGKEGLSVSGLRLRFPRLDEAPFDSKRKMMSTLHDLEGKRRILVKGAPDVLLGRCGFYEKEGNAVPFGETDKRVAMRELEEMAAGALRVLAFAWKDAAGKTRIDPADENDLVFVGMAGMIDPPRPEAKNALEMAADAGMRTVMITGDNLLTAKAVAGELGMLREGDEVLTGQELQALSDEELVSRVHKVRVFARVWPEQKLRIVEALQARREVVAMTGDGVNDAPALKKADIGVAMGITGTDVAKETADMVLSDDNFATIVHAIEEGRAIFDNIRKFIVYLLSCNVGEILVIFLPILLGLPSPLFPVQILLINLVTDGLPALALGVDAAEPDTMRRPPRPRKEGIVSPYYVKLTVFNAAFIALAVTASYLIGRRMDAGDPTAGMTMAFVTLCFDELWRAYSFRSERRNFWQICPLGNPHLLGAIALSGAIVLATVLVAPLRGVFRNYELTGAQWGIAILLSFIPFVAYETWKLIRRVRS
jgi:Ca2+-transporting ATPase